VSQYPPGTALLAAPLYAFLWQQADVEVLGADLAGEGVTVAVPVPDLFPAAIVASLTTALAVAFVALTVTQGTGRSRDGMLVAVLLGVGTGAWTVASDSLWQHGPNMLFVALGSYLASRARWTGAGLAFGALALTRPPVLLVGIALGVMQLVRRDFRSSSRLAFGTLPGVAALLSYNWWLFDNLTVSGGYGDGFTDKALDADLGWYIGNIVDALVSPQVGLFIWSPFLAMLAFGAGRAWRDAPEWARYAAVGGVVLLLVQLKANRASGGAGFWYYRYPLESLTALAPLLPAAWNRVWTLGSLGRRALFASSAYAVVVHSLVALR
jgi:hypothetical protein